MKQIHQGAEAVIYNDENNCIVKDRVVKTYRIKKLDDSIRKFRTKREAKVLRKLEEIGVRAPQVLSVNDFAIVMEKINGFKLKDVLINNALIEDDSNKKKCKVYFKNLGKIVAKMHASSIIHSDLTTSNVLVEDLLEDKKNEDQDLVMIDFGLSFFSQKIEDMAVDVHLLKETLRATHPDIHELSFNAFLEGYKFDLSHKVIKRLEIVESRGRYKRYKE